MTVQECLLSERQMVGFLVGLVYISKTHRQTQQHKFLVQKGIKMRTAKELTYLKKPGMHSVGGGAIGLYIYINKAQGKSWIYRYQFMADGVLKRREMGIGSYADITLAEAREKALDLRKLVRQGIDPIAEKLQATSITTLNSTLKASQKSKTFKTCALTFIDNKSAEWSSPKQKAQWLSSLKTYAFPYIGDMQVSDITVHHMKELLDQIWLTKHTTATRVRSRIENIIDYAIVAGYRDTANPATIKSLNAFLPKSSKVFQTTHFASLPYSEVPLLLQDIKKKEGIGFRALELLILTSKRSGEIRNASWSEIDLENGVWTIPSSRMKNGKEHHEPLSPHAIAKLRKLTRYKNHDWLFPGPVTQKPISDMTISKALKSLRESCTPHGFRSSFRQWAAEQTEFPREVCEMALSHNVMSKVEAAYQRSDLFVRRKELMDAWSSYCSL